MISQTLVRRYAQALMALGREDGQYSQYGAELDAFSQLMAMPDLESALSSPIHPKQVRRKVMEAVLAKLKPSRIVDNFLLLLLDKGRIKYVAAISEYYHRLLDEFGGIQRATVTAALPVAEEIREQVKKTLEQLTGKTVILEIKQDTALIGGMMAQVGDLTLDGSIKTQLKNLRESLFKG